MKKTFEVELNAFQDGKIRSVKVPENELTENEHELNLETIFKYGQNDLQSIAGCCSVSVGDVIRYNGERWEVKAIGFDKI